MGAAWRCWQTDQTGRIRIRPRQRQGPEVGGWGRGGAAANQLANQLFLARLLFERVELFHAAGSLTNPNGEPAGSGKCVASVVQRLPSEHAFDLTPRVCSVLLPTVAI